MKFEMPWFMSARAVIEWTRVSDLMPTQKKRTVYLPFNFRTIPFIKPFHSFHTCALFAGRIRFRFPKWKTQQKTNKHACFFVLDYQNNMVAKRKKTLNTPCTNAVFHTNDDNANTHHGYAQNALWLLMSSEWVLVVRDIPCDMKPCAFEVTKRENWWLFGECANLINHLRAFRQITMEFSKFILRHCNKSQLNALQWWMLCLLY